MSAHQVDLNTCKAKIEKLEDEIGRYKTRVNELSPDSKPLKKEHNDYDEYMLVMKNLDKADALLASLVALQASLTTAVDNERSAAERERDREHERMMHQHEGQYDIKIKVVCFYLKDIPFDEVKIRLVRFLCNSRSIAGIIQRDRDTPLDICGCFYTIGSKRTADIINAMALSYGLVDGGYYVNDANLEDDILKARKFYIVKDEPFHEGSPELEVKDGFVERDDDGSVSLSHDVDWSKVQYVDEPGFPEIQKPNFDAIRRHH